MCSLQVRHASALIASIEALNIGSHVLQAVTDDLKVDGTLHPSLIGRIPWTQVFSDNERRRFVGAVIGAEMRRDPDGHPTNLIDVVGWWKATAIGLGAAARAALPTRQRGRPDCLSRLQLGDVDTLGGDQDARILHNHEDEASDE